MSKMVVTMVVALSDQLRLSLVADESAERFLIELLRPLMFR